MKRSEIKRVTPLKPGKPLARKAVLNASPMQAKVPLPRSEIGRNAGPKLAPARPSYTGPTRSVLRTLTRRSDGLCEFWQCLTDAVHTHHRRPRRMGGSKATDTNRASNLLRLCPPHHDWIESQRAKALELGLILRAGSNPAEVPAYLRYGLVLLAEDGTWTETANPTAVKEATR